MCTHKTRLIHKKKATWGNHPQNLKVGYLDMSDPPQRPIMLHQGNPFSTRSICYEDIMHGVKKYKSD